MNNLVLAWGLIVSQVILRMLSPDREVRAQLFCLMAIMVVAKVAGLLWPGVQRMSDKELGVLTLLGSLLVWVVL